MALREAHPLSEVMVRMLDQRRREVFIVLLVRFGDMEITEVETTEDASVVEVDGVSPVPCGLGVMHLFSPMIMKLKKSRCDDDCLRTSRGRPSIQGPI